MKIASIIGVWSRLRAFTLWIAASLGEATGMALLAVLLVSGGAVAADNVAPSFTIGGDIVVNEDTGARSFGNWATNISPGPASDAGQTVHFNITGNTNPGLFSAGPAVGLDGTLTFTTANNAFGFATITITAQDDGGTSGAGVDTSAPQNFNITLNPVNDAPSFTKGANIVSTNHGADPVTNPGWATNIRAGPGNESTQVLNFIVTVANASLFKTLPTIDPQTGTLNFQPTGGASGSTTVTVKLHDDGGTANGGVDTSAPQTFTITINFQNIAPSFTAGANQTVNEDAGPQTVAGWATNISAGQNEAGQALNFIVTAANTALFSAQPAISSAGTLTYTSAPNANGTTTVTVVLHDNGGTANGGADTSAPQTFTIAINAVNDAPSFTKGADQTVNEDAGPQSVPNWATAMSPGPVDESAQSMSFNLTNDNPAMFNVQPAVASDGTLTYTSAQDANGVAHVSVALHDSGGTANGGVDTSATRTFTITVNPINDPPVVGFSGGDFAYFADSSTTPVTPVLTQTSVFDVDSTAFGSLRLDLNGPAEDILSLVGNAGVGIHFDSSNHVVYTPVSGPDVAIGIWSQPIDSRHLLVTFNPQATADAIAGLLQTVCFSDPRGDAVTIGPRSLTITLTDDQGLATSLAPTKTITISSPNDVPSVDVNTTLVVNRFDKGTLIDAAHLHAKDSESSPSTITFVVELPPIDGFLSGTTLFNGKQTFTQLDINAGKITYTNLGGGGNADVFAFSIHDPGRSSDPAFPFLFRIQVNDLAQLTVTSGSLTDLTVNEQAPPITLLPGGAALNGIVVGTRLTVSVEAANSFDLDTHLHDQLTVVGSTPSGGISIGGVPVANIDSKLNGANGSSLAITFLSTVTSVQATAVLSSIQFANNGDNPPSRKRSIQFDLIAVGGAITHQVNRSITILPIGDAPRFVASSAITLTTIVGSSVSDSLQVDDPDSSSLIFNVISNNALQGTVISNPVLLAPTGTDPAASLYAFNFSYQPPPPSANLASESFQIVATDGSGLKTTSPMITVNIVNLSALTVKVISNPVMEVLPADDLELAHAPLRFMGDTASIKVVTLIGNPPSGAIIATDVASGVRYVQWTHQAGVTGLFACAVQVADGNGKIIGYQPMLINVYAKGSVTN